jgi:hypothetical protein
MIIHIITGRINKMLKLQFHAFYLFNTKLNQLVTNQRHYFYTRKLQFQYFFL